MGSYSLRQLRDLVDETLASWPNGYSTYNGVNDCVPSDRIDEITGSLGLIHLSNGLQLHVLQKGAAFGNPKRSVQAEFKFKGTEYRLSVTDPRIKRHYLAQGDGDYALGPSFLTVSLAGEAYKGSHYKLAAAIIGGE